MKDIIESVNKIYKTILIASIAIFLLSISSYILVTLFKVNGNHTWLFIIAIISEVILLISGEKAKTIYKNRQYDPKDMIHIPPENNRHQQIRYLKFRKKLNDFEEEHKSNINKNNIASVIKILSVREEMEKYSNLYAKRFAGFMLTLFVTLIISFLKSPTPINLVKPVFICFILAFFIYQISALIPSPMEKIKELKYFLELYKYEDESELS